MSTFLLIGLSYKSLRDGLIKHGHDYIEVRDIARTKFPNKLSDTRLVEDFSSHEKLIDRLDIALAGRQIDGILATYENYILPAAQIAEHFGLPGIPVEAAEACTDKFIMRQKFTKASQKISPDYAVVASKAEVLDFAKKHQYPLILKPANLSKSLLVTKSHNEAELLANYQRTMTNIDKVYKKYAADRQPKLLIEEFMTGSVHSVDAFVDAEGKPFVLEQVVDYQTGYDIGFDDNFHYSRLLPSKLPADQIASIRDVAALGCQALGMKNSPAHIEIILTKDGPQIVEIGARNGGYRDRMHNWANGIDIIGNEINLALGKQPKIEASRNDPCATLELFPKEPGIFQDINGKDQLKKLPSLAYLSIKAKQGDYVGKSADGHKMCVIVMLHNKDREQFERDLSFVNNDVSVITKS